MTINSVFDTSGFPILGYYVHYYAENVKIKRDDFVECLKKVGIDEKIASKLRLKSAVNKATQELAKEVKRADRNVKVFAKKLAKNATEESVGLVFQEEDTVNLDATFSTDTKAIYQKNEKKVEFSGTFANELERSFEENKDVYDGRNVRAIVLDYLAEICQTITVRRSGGIYFVPEKYIPELEKLQNLFTLLKSKGHDCDVLFTAIVDTDANKGSISHSTADDIRSELETMAKKIADKDAFTERTADTQLEEISKLRDKVSIYESLLNFTAQDLKDKFNSLQEEVFKKLIGSQGA